MNPEILKTVSVFSELTPSEMNLLAQVLIEKVIEPGEWIVKEGEVGFSLFLIESGTVEVVKKNSKAEIIPISSMTQGSIFGEFALLGESIRVADVIAKDRVRLFELSYTAIDELATKSPTLGIKIYKIFAKKLIDKINKTTENFLSIIISSRMAALGEMTSGIAHEINNPLAIIQMNAEMIEQEAEQANQNSESLIKRSKKIQSMVALIAKLIKSVKALTRNSEQDPMVSTPLKEVIEQTLELCSSRLKTGNVELRVDYPESNISLECRSVQISQVILNLLNNAFDAVKKLEKRWVKLAVQDHSDSVIISVSDSGPGIPEDVKKRLFQSFFTTKSAGEGTGLGLKISLKIIESHGGKLSLDPSTPLTNFLIYLPKKQKPQK